MPQTMGSVPATIYIGTTFGDAYEKCALPIEVGEAVSRFREDEIEPEIIEQFRIWATELAEIAEGLEFRALQPEMAE